MAVNNTRTTTATTKKRRPRRRMKKQVRRTFAALLLASAIAVAAIPVEPIQADTSSGASADGLEADITSTNIVRTVHATDSSNDTFEKINGKDVTSDWKSKVPVLEPVKYNSSTGKLEGDTIYIDDTGYIQFAYVKENPTSNNRVVVITGINNKAISDGTMTLPAQVDAYKQYDKSTSAGDYCAVTGDGSFLYYKTTGQKKDDANRLVYQAYIHELNSAYSSTARGTSDADGETLPSANTDSVLSDATKLVTVYVDSSDPTGANTEIVDESGNTISRETYGLTIQTDSNNICTGLIQSYKRLELQMENGVIATPHTVVENTYKYENIGVSPVSGSSFSPCYKNSKSTWYTGSDTTVELYYWAGDQDNVDLDWDGTGTGFEKVKTKEESSDKQWIHQVDVSYIGMQKTASLTYTDASGKSRETYTVTEPTTMSLSGGTDNPENGVFYGNGDLKHLVITGNLLGIGDYAFYQCSNLEDITITDKINTIGNGAFYGCTSLKEFAPPSNANLSIIGASAFQNCTSLTSVVLPTYTKAIGDRAFMGDGELTTINMNQSPSAMTLNIIGYKAFQDCGKLTELVFPASLKQELPVHYLKGCKSLKRIMSYDTTYTFDIVDTNSTETSEPTSKHNDSCDITNWLKNTVSASFYFEGDDASALHQTAKDHSATFLYDDGAYKGEYEVVKECDEDPSHASTYIVNTSGQLDKVDIADGCKNIVIPAQVGDYGIKTLGKTAFNYNCSLEMVTIPNTVESIESGAFTGCHNLKYVVFSSPANTKLTLGDGAFKTQAMKTVSDSVSGETVCAKCGEKVNENPSLMFVGDIETSYAPFTYAMNASNNIDNFNSQPLTYIEYCSGWPTLLTVQYNPNNAEGERNELVDYPTEASVTSITKTSYPYLSDDEIAGATTFSGTEETRRSAYQSAAASSFKNITIPAGVTSIKDGIFSDINPDGTTNTDHGISDAETLVMTSVKNIDAYTFANMDNLKSIDIAGCSSIGNYAFMNDTQLGADSSTVRVSGDTTSLGLRPFRGCTSLSNVDFLNGTFTCANAIIYNSDKTEVKECLPARGTKVASIGFVGESDVTTDEMGAVTTLDAEAFMDCDGVKNVDLSESSGLTEIPERCFAATDTLSTIKFPESLRSVKSDAFLDSTVSTVEIPNEKTNIAENAFAETQYGNADDGNLEQPIEGYHVETSGNTYNPYKADADVSRKVMFYTPTDSTADYYADNYDYIDSTDKPVEYTVNYYDIYADDPTVPYYTESVTGGQKSKGPLTNPSHEGKTFSKWTPDPADTVITKATDFTSVYEGETLTVTFYNEDGTEILNQQTVAFGGSAATPDDPTKEGYTFVGWRPTKSFTNITEDITVYATFEKIDSSSKHTVKFLDWDDKVLSEQLVEDGGAAETPADPTREGYTFTGWIPKDFTNITADTTIWAQYTEGSVTDKYVVTFVDYDGTVLKEEYVTVGNAATAPSDPVRSGYTFSQWVPSDFSSVTSDMTITATYIPNSDDDDDVVTSDHLVTFYNYDDTIVSQQYVEDGGAAVKPSDPVRSGYTFTGWLPSDFSNITADTKIYAQFEKNTETTTDTYFTVIFYNYDDTVVSKQVVKKGESASTPTSPTRSGYKFTGWRPSEYSNITTDMSIYAMYDAESTGSTTKEKYTVTVVNGSGSGSYEQDATVVITANDPATGKVFSKWTTGDATLASTTMSATSFKMPAKAVTVTANYTDGTSKNSVGYATGNAARPSSTVVTKTGQTATADTAGTAAAQTTPATASADTPVSTASGDTSVVVSKQGVSNVDVASATVSGSTDNFIVKVTESNDATSAVENAIKNRYGSLDNIEYWPCDISLYDSTGTNVITDTTGLSVDITIPLPDSLRSYGGNNKVAAVTDGSLQDLDVRYNTINGTPTVSFTAPHFSPYVIYADTANLDAAQLMDASPKTGDPIHPKWFLAIGMAAASVVLFLKKDRKKVKVANT